MTDIADRTDDATAETEPAEELPTHLPASETRAGPGSGRFGVAAMPTEKSKDFRVAVGRLGTLLRPERSTLVVVALASLFGTILGVIGPKLLANATNVIVDGVFTQRAVDYDALHRQLLEVGGLYLASWALSLAMAWLLAGVVQRTMFGLRRAAEDKLNVLPMGYVDRQARGDLLSRVTNDIDNIAQSLQQTLSQMLSSFLMIVGVLVMMFTISWLVAVVACVTVPLSIWAMRAIAGRARPRYIAQWVNTGALNGQIEEAFTGHALVKTFGRQREVKDRFAAKNDELYEASFGAQFMSSLMQPATLFLGNVQYVSVAVVGGLRVASGQMTIGDVQAFIQYSRQFSQPLTHLASMMNVFQSGIASLERVLELLDAPEQSPEAPPTVDATPTRGRVEFDDVAFSYVPEVPLIEGLDLVAEPGQTIAIVGPTGAGKTTLVNLIMRFYELNGGSIRLDGRDITSMPRAELRGNVGMVLQDTWLFGGTIWDNIAYGNPSASDAQILEAARATYVDRFVNTLPDGYQTVINEEGDNISAGQKQLLTIARAFLADPAILILDEATSSVDTRTEVLIQEAMNALRASRTSFVIAHRLSTIRGADVILVMEHGHIVEQGSHAELLARGGAYATLYNAQLQRAMDDAACEADVLDHPAASAASPTATEPAPAADVSAEEPVATDVPATPADEPPTTEAAAPGHLAPFAPVARHTSARVGAPAQRRRGRVVAAVVGAAAVSYVLGRFAPRRR